MWRKVLYVVLVIMTLAVAGFFYWRSGTQAPASSHDASANKSHDPEFSFSREENARTDALKVKESSKGLPAVVGESSSLSFETAHDLFELAVRASNTDDRMVLINGASAIGICVDADVHQSRVGHLFNATPDDPKERERARAATNLLSRCRGFVNNDLSAIRMLRREIWRKLSNQGGYAPGVSDSEMTAAEFKGIIDRQDWLGFEYGLNLAAKQHGTSTTEKALFGIAYTAAGCDLGKDCGPNSVTYAAHCLRTGDCLGSWEKVFLKGLNEQQQETVNKYRRQIVDAVKTKNYEFFGLK